MTIFFRFFAFNNCIMRTFSFSQTRENFDETKTKAEELKAKYMDSKMVKMRLLFFNFCSINLFVFVLIFFLLTQQMCTYL